MAAWPAAGVTQNVANQTYDVIVAHPLNVVLGVLSSPAPGFSQYPAYLFQMLVWSLARGDSTWCETGGATTLACKLTRLIMDATLQSARASRSMHTYIWL